MGFREFFHTLELGKTKTTTMEKVFVFLADGFEEIEALTVVDVLRRAGLEVEMVSVKPERRVTGAHGICVRCDTVFGECLFGQAAALVLPGGMPGAANLDAHKGLRKLLAESVAAGKTVAAICAAPLVLGHLGVLSGRRATCYPGFESELEGAAVTGALVERDGNIVTGRGPGVAMEFAMTLAGMLCGPGKVAELKKAMIVQ